MIIIYYFNYKRAYAIRPYEATHRNPRAQTPEPPTRTQEPPDHWGSSKDPARKTTTGSPEPTARATPPQVPEPNPRKDREGTQRGGQAEEGKATNLEEAPSKRAEREAKAPRPRKDPTEKTTAPGQTDRTRKSRPPAHPVATPKPEDSTEETKEATRGRQAKGSDREPSKATNSTEEPNKSDKKTSTK